MSPESTWRGGIIISLQIVKRMGALLATRGATARSEAELIAKLVREVLEEIEESGDERGQERLRKLLELAWRKGCYLEVVLLSGLDVDPL